MPCACIAYHPTVRALNKTRHRPNSPAVEASAYICYTILTITCTTAHTTTASAPSHTRDTATVSRVSALWYNCHACVRCGHTTVITQGSNVSPIGTYERNPLTFRLTRTLTVRCTATVSALPTVVVCGECTAAVAHSVSALSTRSTLDRTLLTVFSRRHYLS